VTEVNQKRQDITFYACIPDSRTAASTVFKFYEVEDLPPERYSVSEGWISDKTLFNRLASGELTDADIISPEESEKIIRRLHDEAKPD